MSQFECQVTDISPLTEVVYKVELAPAESIEFEAGQYIMVHMGENDKRPFSIANAAYDNKRIELHIGADESNTYATEVLDKMKSEGKVTLSGGHGHAHLRDGAMPKIVIAGGTGFSYAYSIVLQALHNDPNANVTLYWGAKQKADLYLFDEISGLAQKHKHFSFVPVVEEADENWQGKTGWVHHAVLDDVADFSSVQVYIAGRFEMAKTARADFTAKGLALENLFGDAYAFI